MTRDVRERIYHVLECSNKLKRAQLSDSATFEELGFDSLDAVELIVAFEEELGFDLPHEEAENNIKTGNSCLAVVLQNFGDNCQLRMPFQFSLDTSKLASENNSKTKTNPRKPIQPRTQKTQNRNNHRIVCGLLTSKVTYFSATK